MADKTIGELDAVKVGALPVAPDIYDDTLLVAEQQGEARRISGKQWTDYARAAAAAYVKIATDAAGEAVDAKDVATDKADQASRDAAEIARQLAALYALSVTAKGLPPGREPTVEVTFIAGFANFLFGIPKGEQGDKGETGPQGVSVDRVELVEGDHSPGTTDTYKLFLTDGSESVFYVTNGRDGEQGPQGEPGRDAVAVEAAGQYFFQIENGDLYVYYTGDEAPAFTLEDDGNLYLEVSA